jgi:fatty-acyl-CoA synthase
MGLRITWMHPLGSEDDHAYLLEDSQRHARSSSTRPRSPSGRDALRRGCHARRGYWGWGRATSATTSSPKLRVAHPRPWWPPQAHADDVCVLIYTGGTTGRPKGVIHTHRVHVTMVMTELAEWDWPRETASWR